MNGNGASFAISAQRSDSGESLSSDRIYAELDLIGTMSGPKLLPALELFGEIDPPATYDYSLAPQLDGLLDLGLVNNVLARTEPRVQILGRPIITIGGEEVDPSRITGTFRMSEIIGGARSFSFQIPSHSDLNTDSAGSTFVAFSNPFGEDWLEAWLGAPPGKRDIDIEWIVPSGSTYYRVPIVTGGIVENATLVQQEDGDVWQINCVGKEQRLDRQKVSAEIPPGHGMSLGELIKRIVGALEGIDEADVPVFVTRDECPIASERHKEVILKDDSGWRLANEILGLFNYRLRVARDGSLTIQYMGRETPAASAGDPNVRWDWNLTTQDLLADNGIQFSPANDGPTAVRVTGSEQSVYADGDSALKTSLLRTVTEGEYTRRGATAKIANIAGDLTPLSGNDVSGFMKISESEILRTTLFGSPISETVTNRAWYNPEVRTGILQTNGTTNWITGTLVRDGRGIQFLREEWMEVARKDVVYFYVQRVNDSGGIDLTLQQIGTFTRNHYNPRGAVANVSSTGALTWINGRFLSFAGEGLSLSSEFYLHTGTVLRDIWSSNGFITLDRTQIWKYFAPPGNAKLYATGRTSISSTEGFQLWEEISTEFVRRGDEDHTQIVTTRAFHGDTSPLLVVTTDFEGYIPAVPIVDAVLPDTDEYPASKLTSRSEGQAFEVVFRSEELEQHRQPYEETFSSPYLENANEALCWARHIVAEASAIPIQIELPTNPIIEPGHRMRLDAGVKADTLMGVYDTKVEETHLTYDWDSGEGETTVHLKAYVI